MSKKKGSNQKKEKLIKKKGGKKFKKDRISLEKCLLIAKMYSDPARRLAQTFTANSNSTASVYQ